MAASELGGLTQKAAACFSWLAERGLAPRDMPIDAPPAPEFTMGGKRYVSFSSNNYLGLSRRPEVIQAAQGALDRFTMGTCESRRLGGNIALLEELEAHLAQFKHGEAAMVFATGLLANVAVIPGLMDAEWYCHRFYGRDWDQAGGLILADTLNHRSIQMGIRLSRAKQLKYHHGDMDCLAKLLDQHGGRNTLIVTDSIFSMDGDLAPLPEITQLAARYGATVMVDDAHGTGVYGACGRGVAEHFGVEERIHIHMGTLSKALGAMGGFVVAPREVVAFLKSSASGYRFTSSLPAEQAAGIIRSLQILQAEPELRWCLWRNVRLFLEGMWALGFLVPWRWSPIVPLVLGDASQAFAAERILLDQGISCMAIVPPLVANQSSRLRITLNATHTQDHVHRLLAGLQAVDRHVRLPRVQDAGAGWQTFIQSTPAYLREKIG